MLIAENNLSAMTMFIFGNYFPLFCGKFAGFPAMENWRILLQLESAVWRHGKALQLGIPSLAADSGTTEQIKNQLYYIIRYSSIELYIFFQIQFDQYRII